MSKHLVLSLKPYDFTNKEGQRILGVKVAYINKKPNKDAKGFTPFIVNVSDEELFSKFIEVPAIYEMDFEQVTGKNNKPEIVLTDVDFIAPVDIAEIIKSAC
ncbi:hypothetical protein ADU78_10385 [Clostridium botulinum]|uniref:hypothetical protein n=1 Tax=Clostridium botulinum TaxID=1491 RepID=UPI00069A9727|nr:hypothetical protein [Clostridium botulinum]KOA74566.1 hypothetical protein ADU78_10385 [Clostridium botulinum]